MWLMLPTMQTFGKDLMTSTAIWLKLNWSRFFWEAQSSLSILLTRFAHLLSKFKAQCKSMKTIQFGRIWFNWLISSSQLNKKEKLTQHCKYSMVSSASLWIISFNTKPNLHKPSQKHCSINHWTLSLPLCKPPQISFQLLKEKTPNLSQSWFPLWQK